MSDSLPFAKTWRVRLGQQFRIFEKIGHKQRLPVAFCRTTMLVNFILDRIFPDKKAKKAFTVQYNLTKLARLGGYLARASDPPPGPLVIWRGLMKLNDFQRAVLLGFEP